MRLFGCCVRILLLRGIRCLSAGNADDAKFGANGPCESGGKTTIGGSRNHYFNRREDRQPARDQSDSLAQCIDRKRVPSPFCCIFEVSNVGAPTGARLSVPTQSHSEVGPLEFSGNMSCNVSANS